MHIPTYPLQTLTCHLKLDHIFKKEQKNTSLRRLLSPRQHIADLQVTLPAEGPPTR